MKKHSKSDDIRRLIAEGKKDGEIARELGVETGHVHTVRRDLAEPGWRRRYFEDYHRRMSSDPAYVERKRRAAREYARRRRLAEKSGSQEARS